MYFTDIHSHMLGGVDDGARDEAEMLRMLDIAYTSGTRAICFTPHFAPGCFGDTRKKSEAAFAAAVAYGAERYPDMRLCLGNELLYHEGCVDALTNGECRTMNGTRRVLVDFPFDTPFVRIYSAMRDLLSSGFIPILAHAERYDCIKSPFKSLMELGEMGVIIQVNSTSLCGAWGRRIRKKTIKLLKKHIPDLLASDCHRPDGRHPRLDESAAAVRRLCGEKYAKAILCDNPSDIIGIK